MTITHEEVIELAREAGGYKSPHYPDNLVMDEYDLERFAQAVYRKAIEDAAEVVRNEFPSIGSMFCSDDVEDVTDATLKLRG